MATDQGTVEYRDIPEFPGYRAGDDGSIWTSLMPKGKGNVQDGPFVSGGPWRRLKTSLNRFGYEEIFRRPRIGQRQVHRLVLLAFRGPCPGGMECRHLDGNRANNRLENLCWGTKRQNFDDRARHGTMPRGERNPRHVLTESQVRTIRTAYAAGVGGQARLAQQYGVTKHLIALIVHRKIWKHID